MCVAVCSSDQEDQESTALEGAEEGGLFIITRNNKFGKYYKPVAKRRSRRTQDSNNKMSASHNKELKTEDQNTA